MTVSLTPAISQPEGEGDLERGARDFVVRFDFLWMSARKSMTVTLDAADDCPQTWGISLPILHEIRHGLKRLAETGENTLIDLSTIPFAPADEARLLGLLGEGEVRAEVNALGPTWVWESGVHGVWLVDHRNLEGQRLTLHIEIARIPDILRTQRQDVEDAIMELDARIAAGATEPNAESQVWN
jgi:hydrogenase-1 operon protein HyaF